MEHRIRAFGNALALSILALIFAPLADAQSVREVLRKSPNAERGAELFRNCVACHGAEGLGASDGTVPVIAGQHASVIVKQVIDYRHAKRWDIRMERIADQHLLKSPQDIADVATYASRLPRQAPLSLGDGKWSAEGAETYKQRCARCHGAAGEGNAQRLVPRLASQHYDYLLRQMYDTVEGIRPNASASHKQLLEAFVMEDFEGVADYLSRIAPRERDN